MLNSAQRARMGTISPSEELGRELHKSKNVLKAIYDFAVLGGAVGDVLLVDDDGQAAMIPAKAVVTRAWSETITSVLSSGSATVAGKLVGAADIQAATAKATLVAGAFVEGVPVGTAATFVKQSGAAPAQVKATIAVAALTAGKIAYYLEYVLSE